MAVNTNLIDYNDGIKRFDGSEELYRKNLNKFVFDTCFSELTKAIKEERFSDAYKNVYVLKGNVRNLSLMRLYHQLIPLEELLRHESDINTTTAVCNSLIETHDRTVYAIKKELNIL